MARNDETTMTASLPAFDVDAWQSGIGERDTLQGTCFESYWETLRSSGTTTTFDGFSVLGRMAMYKYLIFELDEPSTWNKIRNFWLFHWLWGYGAQLDWQYRSGRLSVGSDDDGEFNRNGDRISTRSWWGFMNFCFSVCILLGAEKAGLIAQGKVTLDNKSIELVERNESVRACIDQWSDLFREPYRMYKNAVSNLNQESHEFAMARFQFQKEIWKAHTAVIYATMGHQRKDADNEQLRQMLQLLPEPEQKFGLGWCRMVELLASLTYPTHMRTLMRDGAGYLPVTIVTPELLKEWQKSVSALSKCDRRRLESIQVTHKLCRAPHRALLLVAGFYYGVVQTPEIAESMPRTIVTMTSGSPVEKFQQMIRLLALFGRPFLSHLLPRGLLEWTLASAVVAVAALAVHREMRSTDADD
jgi:hypothetical protein